VPGNQVTVPMGATSVTVPVTSTAAGTATLTAQLATGPVAMVTATVRALDGTEQPALVSLTPATATIAPGGMATFTVTLDIPAPTGGTAVTLAVAPVGAGTVPPTVTVPAGQLSTTFTYADASMAGSITVSATLGATTRTAMVTAVTSTAGLIINEVDYDMPGAGDSVEFVELYNAGATPVTLADYTLILINGNGTPAAYRSLALGGAGTTLAPGGYLLIGAAAVTGGGTKFTPPVGAADNQWPATDAIQNGAPDGLLLVNTATTTVVDKLAYEGAVSITFAAPSPFVAFGTVNLVEMTAATAIDDPAATASMVRIPNGTDTNNAAADWAMTTTLTPGAANVP
jgi:hypothetical protein